MEIAKKEIFICEISIIFLICLKLALVRPLQQKFNLPLPYSWWMFGIWDWFEKMLIHTQFSRLFKSNILLQTSNFGPIFLLLLIHILMEHPILKS